MRVAVPVSGHPVDSVNLKDPRLGFYEELSDLVRRHGVPQLLGVLRIVPAHADDL